MTDPMIIRGLSVMAPLVAAAVAWAVVRPGRRAAAGALLATLWVVATLVPLNLLAIRLGWWTFHAEGGLFLGLPVDLLVGWAVMWGVLPIVLMRRWPMAILVAMFVWVDLLAMPRMAPVLVLREGWLMGEAAAVGIALIPAVLLGRWTRDARALVRRATMQLALFATLVYGLLPAAIVAHRGGGDIAWPTSWPTWWLALAAQTLAVVLLPGLAALHRFVTDGEGTPLPYDPPRRLVTSGPYAYVANPMQVSTALGLAVWGLLLDEPSVALAGPMAVAFCHGVALWHERVELASRFGEPWRGYRAAVRDWWPRWRPYVAPGPPDRLYVAASCEACAAVGRWFARRSVAGVVLIPAEEHPTRRLRRLRYETGDGRHAWDGVAAVGRALERVHLGWAMVGWLVTLPLIRPAAQLLVDAVGGGPRTLKPPITKAHG